MTSHWSEIEWFKLTNNSLFGLPELQLAIQVPGFVAVNVQRIINNFRVFVKNYLTFMLAEKSSRNAKHWKRKGLQPSAGCCLCREGQVTPSETQHWQQRTSSLAREPAERKGFISALHLFPIAPAHYTSTIEQLEWLPSSLVHASLIECN